MIRIENIPDLFEGPARNTIMSKSTAVLHSYERSTFDYSGMEPAAAEAVQQAAGRIRDRQRAAILDIGRELNAVKAALPHGCFTPWLLAEFGWSQSTANNYMRVADTIGDKFATVAHLPPTVIYKLASPSTPPEIREQVLRIEPGKTVDPRYVVRLIDETKERQEKVERRAREKNPTPEDLARAQKKEQREARERAKQNAKAAAAIAAGQEAAQIVMHALGDQLITLQARLSETNWIGHHAFLDALTKGALDRDSA